ncbi:hypothetical protein SAMN04489729_1581 [Amycolatopsis lurida]|uniref:Aminoacyl-transfer RNA synthetases class-II family profile domain-containing protein n=1 Tax=Amycolatopsis lurida NRRL 2430 TaxID=1460371 RepID=A0A2P2FZD6_AMYLU|nr:hypothetical protein [Amycolatopsis lurida]KFU82065.1 hypothetical protein BB31_06930 [Amycolatopsis lurida NRRL 2430]SEC44107.1 hypothetical protein SAMN04489729_1581 [Amycolatopsis lurida]
MTRSPVTGTLRVELDPPVPADRAEYLATRVFFVSETILDFTLVWSDDRVHAVDLVLDGDADRAGLELRFAQLVRSDVLARRQVDQQVLWSMSPATPPRDVFGELLASGTAIEAGDGQIALGEPVLSLLDTLDRLITGIVREEFEPREYRYPTLIPTSVMARSGYFRSFPQMMMFASRLHGDLETYQRFRDRLGTGENLPAELKEYSGDFDHCLPPTMCFHTYHQLTGRTLTEGPTVITARGKSFRYEARYRRSLERLWDFTIREIVFLGSRAEVLDCRERLMLRSRELVSALGLGGRCEVASDPFFVDAGLVERVWAQQVLRLKYEFRSPIEPGRDLAVCSFNFHERFFGDAYEITGADGAAAFTACAGFGLERLAYAVLCQHGTDPLGWPEVLAG